MDASIEGAIDTLSCWRGVTMRMVGLVVWRGDDDKFLVVSLFWRTEVGASLAGGSKGAAVSRDVEFGSGVL